MPPHYITPRIGKWLPEDHLVLNRWIGRLVERVTSPNDTTLVLPVIVEFENLITSDPILKMQFQQMFYQVPTKPPYDKDPTKLHPQVRDYQTMLKCFNYIIQNAPPFEANTGLVGFPINAVVDWPMGTPAGNSVFLNEKVNAQIKKMLDVWTQYLISSDSRNVLTTDQDGWLGPVAMSEMSGFQTEFVCDPSQPYWGFQSWDDFFTRQFRDGQRPVAYPDNNMVINNACESAPYAFATNVAKDATFWIKGQPYAVEYMLGLQGADLVDHFVGGTIYQAFLSALSYHRWHSPVNGTIVQTYIVPGTYYSEARFAGFDAAAPNDSQGYITEVATRGLIYIQADNPDIGLMCFMAVGMAEVSSCDIQVQVGEVVKKGDSLGMFHFGGSTHCLMFRKGVNIQRVEPYQTPGLDTVNVPVNSAILAVIPTPSY